jgi:diadenosine tetraphosphate (Ap4A) HIT family hydrolase
MADTIFAKIIAGKIPCHRVYEDEHVLAFLDINPLTRGHTLVIPKEPAETLDKLSDEAAAALASRSTTSSRTTAAALTKRSSTCTFTSSRGRAARKAWACCGRPARWSRAKPPSW